MDHNSNGVIFIQNGNTYPNWKVMPAVSSVISQKKINNVWLQLHNNARENANVRSIEWDEMLADAAREYAKKCTFRHSNDALNGYVGENISLGIPSEKYNNINSIFTGWMSERNNCPSFNPNSIGHYTQIINPRVTKIGCGCAICENVTGLIPENNGIICVCRYDKIQNLNEVQCSGYYPKILSDAIPL